MGLSPKTSRRLKISFTHGLKDIYYAENQILEALPKLIESAPIRSFKRALRTTSKRPKSKYPRLEQIFEMREEKPKGALAERRVNAVAQGRRPVGKARAVGRKKPQPKAA